jgi:hypothetical protein
LSQPHLDIITGPVDKKGSCPQCLEVPDGTAAVELRVTFREPPYDPGDLIQELALLCPQTTLWIP